jgi:D-alanyl-D-alanine carboxypeptidase (penicillin-binding protein 5/6)
MMRRPALQALLLLFALFPGLAVEGQPAQPLPGPPPVEAKSYMLLDYHTGQVLAEGDPDARVEPASLTKIMTAYVAFDALKGGRIKLADQVLVSEKAWRTGGSRMFIEVGKTVSVDDLLKGVIVQSGNDATVALAEHIAGSEEAFAGLMNRHGQRLGLKGSHFTNASGLPDPEHYTTARDLATLGAALIRDFPEYYPMHALREFTFNNIVQHNRNRLLWQEAGVDGIKTGHTESAGYCLVVSGERESMRLIAAILGAASEKARTAEARKLLGYGFRFYEGRELHPANVSLSRVPVWKGEAGEVDLGLERGLYVTVPRGQAGNVSVSLQVDPLIVAPVARGERKGTVRVRLGGKDLLERPLVALQPVNEGGFLRRWIDGALLLFQ